jgi:ATP/maltotriose-dependent transcriptional regulator MalT
MLLPIHAAFLASLGRIQEARELCEAGTEEARLTGNPQGLAWVLFALAHAELYAGDLDAALASARESVEVARGRVTGMVDCYTGQVLGAVLIESGEPARGVQAMLAQGGGPGLDLVPGAWRAYYLERLVAGRLALGQRPEAETAAAAAAEIAAATGLRTAAIASRRAAAQLALDAGDHDAAAEEALVAAAAADEIQAGVDAALSRVLAGRAFAAAGRPDRAMPELQRAANELDGFGAHRWRAEAERELRKLGNRKLHRRTRRGTPDAVGVASLTERELQIARLIVDRRTNPQIAAELFLSPKTVESHVRNLFHKLDVSSRVDVARVVERADASPYG